MTGPELRKEYFENVRHREWAKVDELIERIAQELDYVPECEVVELSERSLTILDEFDKAIQAM